jgi:N-acetyl-gamma-glutamyl-phosphate reductase common form
VSERIRAVVLGGSGYVAGELLRLLAAHPHIDVAAAVSESRAGQPIAAAFPHLGSAYGDTAFVAGRSWLDGFASGDRLALFSAAPHGASAAVVATALAEAGAGGVDTHVVDSSADFRYATPEAYAAVYGSPHAAPDLLPEFSCAVPEHATGIPTPHIGHPGCFATAALLATVPLHAAGLGDGTFFVSGITGSTGSGRNPQPGTHHPERHGNLYAYKPLAHRHAPEIAGLAEAACGRPARVHFVPHSGPFARGIHVTVQAKASGVTAHDLRVAFESAYADAPFVEVVDGTPTLKSVVTSNYARVGVAAGGDGVVVMCVIDNLVKGAAGGAVQWMNRLWGLPETAGLTAAAAGWT